MENKTPKKIGKYELISKIAQGGMGALYKAKHPTLGRIVLLKKLTLRGGSQFVERFKREARLMMDFKNDHIVQVHDHFKEGPYYYIVEEFVDGISLDILIRRERYLSNEAAALILFEVCKALKYAHDKQVIHRDIKPGNILISRQGEVKLADFGIATSLDEPEDGLTRDGTMLGTPSYIPPEQIEDAKSVDRRADIYSVGVVLYEMLTGKTPYPGSFTAETIRQIHRGKYIPPRRINPKASRALCRVMRKAMMVKPRRRFQDLGAILRILERRIKRKDPISIQHAVKSVFAGKDIKELFRKRRYWPARLLAAAVLACALAAAGYYFLYRQGYWYEYFASERYGALVISARVDDSYKEPGDVFFKPAVYRDGDGKLTLLSNVDFSPHENPSLGAGRSFVIESRKLYLEAGRYRVKISLEGQLFWSSFMLESRIAQRRLLSTLDGLRITAAQETGAPLSLQVRFTALDANTGQDITAGAILSVFLNGRWVPWRPGAEGLSSGSTYRFLMEREGYVPQEFAVIVKPYQTLFNLEVGMVPRSGVETNRGRK